jgi:predicted nucleic acid-binding protein
MSDLYLLDTNVISEFRKTEAGRGSTEVARWAAQVEAGSLYLSVMTLLELEIGVLLIGRRDPEQARMLKDWIDGYVVTSFSGRILDMDRDIALRCAALHVPDKRPERDAWIAATALVHGMTMVTRNVADFQPMGVAVFNPWEY